MGRKSQTELLDDAYIRDEVNFYDALDNFADVLNRLNKKAANGAAVKHLENQMCRLIPEFILLCGVDSDGRIDTSQFAATKKVGRLKKTEPEPLPANFIMEKDGWGLCPVCRRKIVKLTGATKLVDFPAYCKSCKADYVVSWWNADNKEIAYTRYVNNAHYIDRGNIRSEGLKGTSVQNFIRSRTSATERTALHLS